ncbi:amino acid lyase [Amedibacterium intestinale]|uniref:threonine aldolase family protein n=1 Tax=Amedibacterium intestinale TaxID=2583452 RepID=UPI0013746217|nr:low specificity L-threonine aldolase [Amedibacterium intestinale]BBK61484.1 amino acid lyase [Amedibacterium intestinale]
MYSFKNDYSEGALPAIMELLNKSNCEQTNGYGEDYFCEEAKKKIKDRLQYKACDVHFLVGGTQTNLTVIASALRPYEAVIAADTGHINVHETGAIEASGHKVLTVKGTDGKVTSEAVRKVVLDHEDEHMVKPTMVYISNATEIGTMYLKEELQELYATCKELGLYLFMDGARLGSALMAQNNNITWEDLCSLCDVFYIGGTKNGTLFGEALVIVNEELKKDFRYMIKQRGGLLAKGRLLGIQFLGLFENENFEKAAKHANNMAGKLQNAFIQKKIPLFISTTTNQIFPILTNIQMDILSKKYAFQIWEKLDNEHTAVRFVTSWATKEEAVEECIQDILRLEA